MWSNVQVQRNLRKPWTGQCQRYDTASKVCNWLLIFYIPKVGPIWSTWSLIEATGNDVEFDRVELSSEPEMIRATFRFKLMILKWIPLRRFRGNQYRWYGEILSTSVCELSPPHRYPLASGLDDSSCLYRGQGLHWNVHRVEVGYPVFNLFSPIGDLTTGETGKTILCVSAC